MGRMMKMKRDNAELVKVTVKCHGGAVQRCERKSETIPVTTWKGKTPAGSCVMRDPAFAACPRQDKFNVKLALHTP